MNSKKKKNKSSVSPCVACENVSAEHHVLVARHHDTNDISLALTFVTLYLVVPHMGCEV